MKNSPKNGFTLIEIIVVLIILGLLAAIALPSYFDFINKSRIAEAFAEMATIKNNFVACLRTHQGEEHLCFINTGGCGLSVNGGGSPSPERCQQVNVFHSDHFNYTTSNYDLAPTHLPDSPTFSPHPDDHQGWSVMASNGEVFIIISGTGDDAQTTCFATKVTGTTFSDAGGYC